MNKYTLVDYTIMQSALAPIEKIVLAHIISRAKGDANTCTVATSKLAESCGCSIRTAQITIQKLLKGGYITIAYIPYKAITPTGKQPPKYGTDKTKKDSQANLDSQAKKDSSETNLDSSETNLDSFGVTNLDSPYNNNIEIYNNNNNNVHTKSHCDIETAEQYFNDWWKFYIANRIHTPAGVKANARKSYMRITSKGKVTHETLAKETQRVLALYKQAGTYTPNASTFLNQERWTQQADEFSLGATPRLTKPLHQMTAGQTNQAVREAIRNMPDDDKPAY